MDHFDGSLTPEFAWKNDLLNEQRRTNELLTRLIDLQQKPKEIDLQQQQEQKQTPQERKQRPGKKVDNNVSALSRRERN